MNEIQINHAAMALSRLRETKLRSLGIIEPLKIKGNMTFEEIIKTNRAHIISVPTGDIGNVSINDSVSIAPGIRRSDLGPWANLYPTLSAWLLDLECPSMLAAWASAQNDKDRLPSLLRRWQSLGRPLIDWPESSQETTKNQQLQ